MARSKVNTNSRTRSTPRKIKALMTHEETQGVAGSPLCCWKVKVDLRESHGPQSPEGRSKPCCSQRNPDGEMARAEEPSSRASTRTSRSRKASPGPGQAQASLKSTSHRSRTPSAMPNTESRGDQKPQYLTTSQTRRIHRYACLSYDETVTGKEVRSVLILIILTTDLFRCCVTPCSENSVTIVFLLVH